MRLIQRFGPRTLEREWGEEIIIAETPQYLGKLLKMRAGTQGGLQAHRIKEETFFLASGRAIVVHDDGQGRLLETPMGPGESYHIPPGAVHQVKACLDCVFIETSTPVYEDRVRCEELYGLRADSGLPTTYVETSVDDASSSQSESTKSVED